MHMRSGNLCGHMLRISMVGAIVHIIVCAIPVDHRSVDSGQLHKQHMVLDNIGVVGIVWADQRVVV